MIILDKVNKYFNKGKKQEVHVINNVSLKLADNGLVALLGSSGSGKTTLLNTIGGLDKIKNGSIYINDQKISSKNSYKVDKIRNLNIGYIFQDYKLIDDLSVFDNVSLVLKIIGIKDKKEIKKRVEYVLDKVGMLRYKKRPAGMLSGGERQRVGIARAIVKDPLIILADEPTGNLDSKNSLEIMKIIKAISRDKLVILVTHEQSLARFYASRIIEIKDGQIDKDYENNVDDSLDYRLDNSFYLKDFKQIEKLNSSNLLIDIYSDCDKEIEKINLDIVFKNGNIYIKSDGAKKVEVVDESSNIEFINDHYKKIEKKDIDKYEFDFKKIINNKINKKYSSILNPITLIINGFKKVFDYPFLKKILLVGFLVSGMFIMYAVSSIARTYTIKDEDFIKYNKNYLAIEQKKVNVDDYLNFEQNKVVNYMMPGNSIASFRLKLNDYFQTNNQIVTISGSLSDIDLLNKDDIILGRYPENDNELVLDKMVLEKAINENDILTMVGLKEINKMLNRTLTIPNMNDFIIVGITDLESPSIYTIKKNFINIFANKEDDGYYIYEEKKDGLVDYMLYFDKVELKKGRYPENDYEVIVNIENEEQMKLNKQIEQKVNNINLTVVGYYYSVDNYNFYLVNKNTIKYDLINRSSNITLYAKDKNLAIDEFRKNNLNVKDTYELSKVEYENSLKDRNKSTLIVSSIIILISLIEMFLMSRSAFLSRIKEIGTYRAIGVKKKDIYKMFSGEIFAITTLTSFPGILFMAYCLKVLSNVPYLGSMFVINPFIVILSIIFVYMFNFIIGLIPVFNVIKKSPASILSRIDAE